MDEIDLAQTKAGISQIVAQLAVLDASNPALTEIIADLKQRKAELEALLAPPAPELVPCGVCNRIIDCPNCRNPITPDGRAPDGVVNFMDQKVKQGNLVHHEVPVRKGEPERGVTIQLHFVSS